MSVNRGTTLQIQYNIDVVLCQLFMIASNSQWLNYVIGYDEKIFDWH